MRIEATEQASLASRTTATDALLDLGTAPWFEDEIQQDKSSTDEADEPVSPPSNTAMEIGLCPHFDSNTAPTMRASIRTALQEAMGATFSQDTPRWVDYQWTPRKKPRSGDQDNEHVWATQAGPTESHMAPSQRSLAATQEGISRTVNRQTAGSLIALHEDLIQEAMPVTPGPRAGPNCDPQEGQGIEPTGSDEAANLAAPVYTGSTAAQQDPSHTHTGILTRKLRVDERDPATLSQKQSYRLARAREYSTRLQETIPKPPFYQPPCNYTK